MCILRDKMDIQKLQILVTNRVPIGVYSFIWIQLNSNFKVDTWNNCNSYNYSFFNYYKPHHVKINVYGNVQDDGLYWNKGLHEENNNNNNNKWAFQKIKHP